MERDEVGQLATREADRTVEALESIADSLKELIEMLQRSEREAKAGE